MKKKLLIFIAVLCTALFLFSAAACDTLLGGTDGGSGSATGRTVNEREWRAAFSDESFQNVTFQYREDDGEDSEGAYEYDIDTLPGAIHIREKDSGSWDKEEYYGVTAEGVYSYSNDFSVDWVASPEPDTDLASLYPFLDIFDSAKIADLFGAMTFDETEHCYIAEGDGTDIPQGNSLSVRFANKQVAEVSATDGKQSITYTFSDYGTTEVKIPESGSEQPDDQEPILPGGATVDERAWQYAFSDKMLGNATISFSVGDMLMQEMLYALDAATPAIYMEDHSGTETQYYYYLQQGSDVLQYERTETDTEWSVSAENNLRLQDTLYWVNELLPLYPEATFSEQEGCYTVENAVLRIFGQIPGTLQFFFEDGYIRMVVFTADADIAPSMMYLFEDYGSTKIDIPADLPAYNPEGPEEPSDNPEEPSEGDPGNPAPEGPVDGSMWDAILSGRQFENMQVVVSMSYNGTVQSVTIEQFTDRSVAYSMISAGSNKEYYQIYSDVAYHYFLYNGSYVKQRVQPTTSLSYSASYLPQLFVGLYSDFVYSPEEDYYYLDHFKYSQGNTQIEMTDVILRFEGESLASFQYTSGGILTFEYSQYGQIQKFDLPGASEIPDGPIENADKVTENEWMQALAEDSFSNVTIIQGVETMYDIGSVGRRNDLLIERSLQNETQLTYASDQNAKFQETYYSQSAEGSYFYYYANDVWQQTACSDGDEPFTARILPVLNNLAKLYGTAECNPINLYILPSLDAGEFGTLYDVSVRFWGGKLMSIRGSSSDLSSDERLVFLFSDYDATEVTLPAVEETFTSADWDALFEEKNFINVSASLQVMDDDISIEHTEIAEISRTHETINSENKEVYYRTENGVTYVYTQRSNRTWGMQANTDPVSQEYRHGYYGQILFFLKQLQGKFDLFQKIDRGIYIAYDITLDMGGGDQVFELCEVTFDGDTLLSVTFTVEKTSSVHISFFSYGITDVRLPDASSALTAEEEFNNALAQSSFSSVTLDATMQDSPIYVLYSAKGEGGISYVQMDTQQGEETFYCDTSEGEMVFYERNESGVWQVSTSSKLDAYSSLMYSVFAMQNRYSSFSYDGEKYVSIESIALEGMNIVFDRVEMTFREGKLIRFIADCNGSNFLTINFSGYGTTAVELPPLAAQ